MRLPALKFTKSHFADAPQLWSEGADNHPPSTFLESKGFREAAIERLRRAGINFAIPRRRLAGCSQRRRCLSAACPVCTFALRRWCVESVPDGATLFVTVIDSNNAPRTGALSGYSLPDFYKSLERQLRNANVEAAIGGVHFDSATGAESFWQPHAHFLAWSHDRAALRRSLKHEWHNNARVYTAVHTRKFDGDLRTLAYALDGRHKQLVKAPKECRNGSTRLRTTKVARLDTKCRSELDEFLNELTVWKRLFYFGFEIEEEMLM